ncbi:MAG: GAF domain-containing protein [Chloroflexi bacterium]|nr:MAG: GAF domain-containing protein [Chloroflexota bacterium]
MLGNVASPLRWTATGDEICESDRSIWCAYTGQCEEAIQAWGWLDAVHPADRELAVLTWSRPEVCATSYRIRRHDGEYRLFKVHNIPIFDHNHHVSEWIVICAEAEDVTVQVKVAEERAQLLRREREICAEAARVEHRVQKAFMTLLTLAEELVRVPEDITVHVMSDGATKEQDVSPDVLQAVGQRLVEVAAQVLECQFVSIVLIKPEKGIIIPVAQVGLTAEMVESLQQQEIEVATLADYVNEGVLARLRANEVVFYDPDKLSFMRRSSYGLYNLLGAPMIIGEQLVGMLILEKKRATARYSDEEIALVKAVAKLISLVIERARLLQEALAARASELALLEANRRFDEFLSIASHELRTPLTTIKGNIQLALRRLNSIQETEHIPTLKGQLERVRTPLRYAEHRVSVQNRMISDLLDVSRIQANKLTLLVQPCNLTAIVREAVEDLQYTAADRTIVLTLAAGDDVPIIADADRIGQVVSNYLTNALKYSPADKPVEIRLEREETLARVVVKDEGPGLPMAEQQRVWERFYRVKDIVAHSGVGGGLGIGLHICRTIITYHQGKVGVESAPGQGSTFWFTVPLAE